MITFAMSPYIVPLLRERPALRGDGSKAERIVETVCEYYLISSKQIYSKCRERRFCVPRQIAMFLIVTKTSLSLKQVGRMFGDRDHTTVIHSRDLVREQLSSVFQNDYKTDYPILEEKLDFINS